MTIKPIGNRVLVRPIKEEEKTINGIILPNSNNSKPSNTGIILEVGSTKENFRLGETIFFIPNTGHSIKDNNETLIILDVENILAII